MLCDAVEALLVQWQQPPPPPTSRGDVCQLLYVISPHRWMEISLNARAVQAQRANDELNVRFHHFPLKMCVYKCIYRYTYIFCPARLGNFFSIPLYIYIRGTVYIYVCMNELKWHTKMNDAQIAEKYFVKGNEDDGGTRARLVSVDFTIARALFFIYNTGKFLFSYFRINIIKRELIYVCTRIYIRGVVCYFLYALRALAGNRNIKVFMYTYIHAYMHGVISFETTNSCLSRHLHALGLGFLLKNLIFHSFSLSLGMYIYVHTRWGESWSECIFPLPQIMIKNAGIKGIPPIYERERQRERAQDAKRGDCIICEYYSSRRRSIYTQRRRVKK